MGRVTVVTRRMPVVESGHREEIHPLRRHLLADIAAERPVDRLVRITRGCKRERHLLCLCDRHHRADDAAHQRKKLDLAREQFLERFWIAAGEFVVLGVDRGHDAAIGLAAYGVPHGNEIAAERAAGRLVVILHERMLGRLHWLDDVRSDRRCASNDRAARQFDYHGRCSDLMNTEAYLCRRHISEPQLYPLGAVPLVQA